MTEVTQRPGIPERPRDADLDTQTIMFLITEACNLRCVYCYEKNKSPRTMSESLVKEIIRRHMAQAEFANLSFDLFGGEPLLEFATIRNIVEWFRRESWLKGHRFTLSTNGTLFDDEMKAWFASWRDCVIPMVSLDGTKDAHNANRCNSYDAVVRHVPFLRENWPTQPLRITVGPSTMDQLAEGIRNIHSFGLPVEAGLIFEDVWGDGDAKDRYLRSYERQLAELVEFYDAHPDLPAPMILSRYVPGVLMEREPGKPFCGAGKYMLCYTPDGTAYPCHRFAPISSSNPSPDPYSRQTSCTEESEKCKGCILLPICPTCQGFNWETNCHTSRRTTFHCDFFKLEVIASAKRLVRKIAKEAGAADLTDQSAADLSRQLVAVHRFINSAVYEQVLGRRH